MNLPSHLTADPGLDAREEFCREIAAEAGRIALAGFHRRDLGEIAMKGAQDFLTETDAAVEDFLKSRILARFAEDAFLGEETGGDVGTESVWVVDPIDGTANFARAIPHFCVSIAYMRKGVTEIGVIHAPATGEFWFARRGQGATCNGHPIQVAATDRFSAACLELGWNNRRPQEDYLLTLTRLLGLGANIRRAASGALGLAYVADGRSDGYIELHMNAWDCLAGLLLVEEAGGRVSTLPDDALKSGMPVLAAVLPLAHSISLASGIALASGPEAVERVVA